MTSQEFDQMCRDICPHCNAGIVARQRPDTQEWVHDSVFGTRGVTSGHSICLATHWRNKNKDRVIV